MAGFDPYYEWLGIPPKDQPPHAYRLLGLDLFEANPKVIEAAAEQRTMLLRSRASGPNSDATQKLLNEVQRARILLLDDAKKKGYDAELRTKVKAAEQAATKALPMAQPLPEPVGIAAPIVSTSDPTRRPAPTPAAGMSLPVILGAAAAGVVVLGVVGYLLTRGGGEKPGPVAQNPPAVIPSPPSPVPKPPVGPAQPPEVSPFVPQPPVGPPMPEPKPPEPPVDPPVTPAGPPPAATPADPPEATPPAQPEQDERRPKPLPAEQEKAIASFREIFKEDLAKAKKPEQWQTLVTKVLEVAGESEGDAATQYVLLEQARQLAASAGLWEPSEQAIALLSEKYQVDGKALRLESLEKALDGPLDPAGRKKLVATAFEIFDSLLAEQQLDKAVQLSKVLTEPVRAARDKDLTAGLAARKKRGGEIFQAQQRLTAARAALKAKPDDAEANLELGKVLMILGRPWEQALKHLAAGSDPGWKAAAEKELAVPQDPDQQVALADAWWDLSERAEAELKPFAQGRAGAWYRTALPQLAGIAKAKAERRLAALPADSVDPGSALTSANDPGPRRPAAKLIKEIYLDELPEDFARVYYGTLGGFGWEDGGAKELPIVVGGKQPAHTLYTHPVGDDRLRGPGIVQYNIDAAFATFSGAVTLNEWQNLEQPRSPAICRVLGDNKVLWTSDPIRRKGELQEFSISVRGVKQLRLEARAEGNAGSCHAIWVMPKLSGGTKPLALLPERLLAHRPHYLDDLVPVDWSTGHLGTLGYLGSAGFNNETVPFFTLQGRRVFHAVGMVPREGKRAYVRYRLDGRYRSLKGVASLQEATPGTEPFHGVVTYLVFGDGRVLWKSPPISKHGDSAPFSVNLAGVQDLELALDLEGSLSRGWSGWLEPELELAKKVTPAADASITADEVVIWNAHNGEARDRGAMTANVLLYQGSDLVGQVPAVRLGWNHNRSIATRVPLPKKSFNRLRVEVTAGTIYEGAGLNEIEVLLGGKNVARQAIATASDNFVDFDPHGIYSAWMINDGITQAKQQQPGYWLLRDHNCGWIELEWRGAAAGATPHPALQYPLARHPYTAIPFGGHWYLYFPGRITWDEAQRRCREMGGYLACIETEPEGRFTDAMARRHSVWLGGTRSPAGKWSWINGQDFRFTRWFPGEPSGGSEDRLEILNGKQWNDAPGDHGGSRGYICEWEQ